MALLHFVIPFFNYSGSNLRLQNLAKVLKSLPPGSSRTVVSDCWPHELTGPLTGIRYEHLRVAGGSTVWQKEHFLNLGVAEAVRDTQWEYLIALDANTYCPNWEEVTQQLTDNVDVKVFQPFDWIANKLPAGLVKDGAGCAGCIKSYAYERRIIGPYAYGSAWGFRRDFIDLARWYPFGVVGGGDALFCAALNSVETRDQTYDTRLLISQQSPQTIFSFKNWLKTYYELNCKRNFKIASLKSNVPWTALNQNRGDGVSRKHEITKNYVITPGVFTNDLSQFYRCDVKGLTWANSVPQELRNGVREFITET